jgi:hypothetical protein
MPIQKKKATKGNDNVNIKKVIINNLPDSLLTLEVFTSNNNHLIEQIPNSLNTLVLHVNKKPDINNYNLIDKKFIIVKVDANRCEYSDEEDDCYSNYFKSYKINIFN